MRSTSIIGIILSALICAEETTVFLTENHRFYIEPDVAYGIPTKVHDEGYTVRESGYLLGVNTGYEFLKPNSLYAGLEANFSMNNRFGDMYFENAKIAEGESKGFQNKASGALGYTLVASNIWFTPFSGAGCYFLSADHAKMYLAYIPIGINAEYRMANLSVGVSAQQMHYVTMWHRYNGTKFSENVFVQGNYGYEISFPISFKMDTSEKHWYGTFEPYYLKLTNATSFVGGRIAGMYNF